MHWLITNKSCKKLHTTMKLHQKTVKCKELESYEMLIGSFLMYKDKIIITGKVKIEYI